MSHLLIVDDETDLASYLAEELQDRGWQTETAGDGVEAVLRVIEGRPDIVLMDVRMPKLDGVQALRIIRRLKPALPVILLTGQAGQGEMLEANRLGAFTCLAKPVTLERLHNTLQQAVAAPMR